jgi:hypothetical protein
MFPNFPHFAEAIAAERAADLQRDAAAYRRARHVRRPRGSADRASVRSHAASRGPAATARPDSCAPVRAI